MSAFEFVFSLFGLLLGFSLVEVLGGLGKVLAGFGLSTALILYYYGEFAVDFFPQTRARGD